MVSLSSCALSLLAGPKLAPLALPPSTTGGRTNPQSFVTHLAHDSDASIRDLDHDYFKVGKQWVLCSRG